MPSRYALNKETIRIRHTISRMEDIHFLNLLICVSIILHHFQKLYCSCYLFFKTIHTLWFILRQGTSLPKGIYFMILFTFFLDNICMHKYTLSYIKRKSELFYQGLGNIFLPNFALLFFVHDILSYSANISSFTGF